MFQRSEESTALRDASLSVTASLSRTLSTFPLLPFDGLLNDRFGLRHRNAARIPNGRSAPDLPVNSTMTMSAFHSILLQKSFWGDEQNFSGLLMRFARGDVRDHVVPRKNDHGPA
jgi:hypothetical protein